MSPANHTLTSNEARPQLRAVKLEGHTHWRESYRDPQLFGT